ncbi:MAG: DUF3365 domain-containing protein [Magnetococcales bacterium]|nr:DUF3365 domain-containing protein [Magnetococcales bacterium]
MTLKLKFILYLLLALLLVFAGAMAHLFSINREIRENELYEHAELLLDFATASRRYVHEVLRPALSSLPGHPFILEGQSGTFVTRNILENLRRENPEYLYRQPSPNPLNPINQASGEDLVLIDYFRNHPESEEIRQYHQDDRESPYFLVARPIRTEPSCLGCHGDPVDAPPEIVDRYGSEHGFHWSAAEVVGVTIITVPAGTVLTTQSAWLGNVVSIFAVLFGILFLTMHFLFQRLVNRRLQETIRVIHAVGSNPGSSPPRLPEVDDEFGELARSFNAMATALNDAQLALESQVAVRTRELTGEIGERRRVEVALRLAKEQADSANRAKSVFLATMSHEIRTPMNGVLGMAQLLQGTALSPEQRRWVEALRRSGESLLTIIDDILDISRIEAGGMKIERWTFDLAELVHDLVTLFSQLARNGKLEFHHRLSPSLPVHLQGDPHHLRQVLNNLLGNAIKFTHHGRITFTVEPEASPPSLPFRFPEADIEPREGADAEPREDEFPERPQFLVRPESLWVRFTVEDTGIGIEPAQQERIFRAFAQADHSPSRHYGGTGLGLAISRRLVQGMAGTLTVKSRPGEGSRFTLILPFDPATGLPARPLPPADLPVPLTPGRPAAAPGVCSILVVEDDPMNREVMLAMMARLGHSATVATGGLEALEILSERSFELILMDCQMPGMDGYAATSAIRESEKSTWRHTPIIAVTAFAMKEDRLRSLAAGMDDHMTKPIALSRLREMLDRWLPSPGGGVTGSAARVSPTGSVPISPGVAEVAAPFFPAQVVPVSPATGAVAGVPSVGEAVQETDEPTAEGSVAESPLDPESLGRLQRSLAAIPGSLDRILDRFLEGAPKLVAELGAGLEDGDLGRIRKAAHTLKSQTATVGALVLSKRCRSLQFLCQENDPDPGAVAELIRAIEREWPEVVAALDSVRRAF